MDETQQNAPAGRADVIERLRSIAFGKANDAVKLVFLEPEQARRIGTFDLTLLSEIKRGANGLVEVKLIDRLEAVELLAKLLGQESEEAAGGAESFFRAIDKAAERSAEDTKDAF